MKLKLDSWHLKLYRWNFDSYRTPKTLCGYFWKTLLTLVLMPLNWFTYIPSSLRDDVSLLSRTFLGTIIQSLIGVVALHIHELGEYGWPASIGLSIIAITVIILGIAIVVGIIWGLIELVKYLSEVVEDKFAYNSSGEPRQYMLVESTKGFINKYCPKIDWE